jgi:hypothetical protein
MAYPKTITDHITDDSFLAGSDKGGRILTAADGETFTPGNVLTVDADGNVEDGGSAPGGGSAASILNEILDWYADNNADSRDHKIVSGDYVAFIHHKRNATSGFTSPSNAVHTVATGKKLVALMVLPMEMMNGGFADRRLRFQNTTDGTTVVKEGQFQQTRLVWPEITNDVNGGKFPEVAAGKTVELQLWNSSATPLQMGGALICKEVTA